MKVVKGGERRIGAVPLRSGSEKLGKDFRFHFLSIAYWMRSMPRIYILSRLYFEKERKLVSDMDFEADWNRKRRRKQYAKKKIGSVLSLILLKSSDFGPTPHS